MNRTRPLSVVRGPDGDLVWWIDGLTLCRGVADEPGHVRFTLARAFEGVSACETHVAVWSHRLVHLLDAVGGAALASIQLEPSYALAEAVAVPTGVEIYGMSNTGYPVDRHGERVRITFDGRRTELARAWGRVPPRGAEGESAEALDGAFHEGPEGTVTLRDGRLFFGAPGERVVELEHAATRALGACAVGALGAERAIASWAFGEWSVWRTRDGALVAAGREPTHVRAIDFANGRLVLYAEGGPPERRPITAPADAGRTS